MAKAKEKMSPMLQQYLSLKEQYPGTLLFFRLGDFYEMFFEDAVLVSRELELTLTGRNCGLTERAPMCGVPHHAIDQYVNRLLAKGYKVAVCEQLTEPGQGKMLERDVVRIITPGTVIETAILDEKANNYLVTLAKQDTRIGLAYCDISTGDFYCTELLENQVQECYDELVRLSPGEILANSAFALWMDAQEILRKNFAGVTSPYREDAFYEAPNAALTQMEGFAQVSEHPVSCSACIAMYGYLQQTQKTALMQLTQVQYYPIDRYMIIDAAARRNLELTETMRGKSRRGSLLWIMDRTQTAMGSRQLRRWLEAPLQSRTEIEKRLDAVSRLHKDPMLCDTLKDALKRIRDMERITTRLSYSTINARDCLALGESAAQVPALRTALQGAMDSALLYQLHEDLDDLTDISSLLQAAIAEDPPLGVKEGGIIRKGYHEELDHLRTAYSSTREVILAMEQQERERTGIKNLRIGFNKVFGFYIEVTNSFASLVPYNYVRKQTLTNAERYITAELKELEDTVMNAEERSMKLEYQLFCEIRDTLRGHFDRLQRTARAIAVLDSLLSMAILARENNYVRPQINDGGEIRIVDGRHPVVEASLSGGEFVPNNTVMDKKSNRFLIITGPNMAGKSTYLRQVAIIVIMAHMGSFVPAREASIGLTDRLYTRVGAADDLFLGQSTFMVEMSEVANILQGATANSLIILDEVGRGTSTFDGLSIAWAIVEHICDKNHLGCKALFATHYHELTELEDKLPGVKNYCITAREIGDDVVFLRKIVRGGADKSFGIQVARLAGLPDGILQRSREILAHLEEEEVRRAMLEENLKDTHAQHGAQEEMAQLSLVDVLPYSATLDEIRSLDINTLTPMDAMFLLNKLKSQM